MILCIIQAFLLALLLCYFITHVLNFLFEHVSFECVTKLVDLDEKKSCGSAGFPPKISKHSTPAIATVVLIYFKPRRSYETQNCYESINIRSRS